MELLVVYLFYMHSLYMDTQNDRIHFNFRGVKLSRITNF